jgi:hypothetical protein
MADKIRVYRKLVKERATLEGLDAIEEQLAMAKRWYATRPSDILSVMTKAEVIASQLEKDAAAESPAAAPSGTFATNLGVPWSEIQRQLRAGAAAYREIIADIDEWTSSDAARGP